MSTSMNVFLTEGNADIYLSKLHLTWKPEERDSLLRLLAREENQMGTSREHLDHAERRILDGRHRIARQRDVVACLTGPGQAGTTDALLLETLLQTQALLEQHLEILRQRRADSRL
jgi:hypothetical protein